MLDVYTFKGQVEFMTFYGPNAYPIAFTLIVAPDADDWLVDQAAKSIGMFLIDQHYLSDTMEDEEEDESGV